MIDQKEANYYRNYIPRMQGAKLKILPSMQYPPAPQPPEKNPYSMAETFMGTIIDSKNKGYLDDLFNQKKELSEDRVNLILGEIHGRETLKHDNLARLYDDLLKVKNWRLERPFPEYYQRDTVWASLNRMEIQIREQIRRELKDAARDTSFPQKDLRESLIDFKLQSQKAQMMEGGLEMSLEDSNQTEKGDVYQHQNHQTPFFY